MRGWKARFTHGGSMVGSFFVHHRSVHSSGGGVPTGGGGGGGGGGERRGGGGGGADSSGGGTVATDLATGWIAAAAATGAATGSLASAVRWLVAGAGWLTAAAARCSHPAAAGASLVSCSGGAYDWYSSNAAPSAPPMTHLDHDRIGGRRHRPTLGHVSPSRAKLTGANELVSACGLSGLGSPL